MNTARRFLLLVTLASALLAAGCSNFDQRRIDTTDQLKQNYAEDVKRAREGKLTDIESRSTLQSFDVAALEELAKKGNKAKLEEERVKREAESEQLVKDIFGGE